MSYFVYEWKDKKHDEKCHHVENHEFNFWFTTLVCFIGQDFVIETLDHVLEIMKPIENFEFVM